MSKDGRRCETCNWWLWAPDVAQRLDSPLATCLTSKDPKHVCPNWQSQERRAAVGEEGERG